MGWRRGMQAALWLPIMMMYRKPKDPHDPAHEPRRHPGRSKSWLGRRHRGRECYPFTRTTFMLVVLGRSAP